MTVSSKEFRDGLKRRISVAYGASGNSLGWRLLASPPSVLDGAEVAFIGMNPAGAKPEDHPEFATNEGVSAYVHETWGDVRTSYEPGGSPLQKQVRALFKGLSMDPVKVLAGNLVPFRSRTWDDLKGRDSALKLGEEVWGEILRRSRPSLVIGMGMEVLDPLSRILKAGGVRRLSVNWGNITARKATFPGGSLVFLPHLSRFGIATRPESGSALRDLFGDRWRGR